MNIHWFVLRLPGKLNHFTVRRIAIGLLALGCGFCVVEFIRLARTADRRLAGGPFSTSTDILSAPETIAVGESLTVDDFVRKLERCGYSHDRDYSGGWFEVQSAAVWISPRDGPERRIHIEFAGDKISAIVGGDANAPRQEYQLDRQLMTNLSGAREKRRLVRFSNIPPSLVNAVTSVEDKHFFYHDGFNIRRIVKAAYVDLKDGRKQEGASTLTMQLARALWLDPSKSWRRKAEEILITCHLEDKLTKQQIFEDYANQIYLGRTGTFSINGFGEAAAHAFFGKDLSRIDTGEAALLAGLVRRPSYYNPFRYPARALSRRNLVLALMLRNGQLTSAGYHAALAAPLKSASPLADDSTNSYFISMMNDELQAELGDAAKHSRSVVTTLDPNLQDAAEAAVRAGMEAVDRQLRQRNNQQATLLPARPQVALVALDPRTGEIKALVGGRNYSVSQFNHVLARRQPGSVFKPFVYAAAIATAVEGGPRTFTPATLLSDESTTFFYGARAYQPRDFHGDYQGDVTLRSALAHSLNVPTVSLAEQVGYRQVVAMARRAGLNDSIKATPPSPSAPTKPLPSKSPPLTLCSPTRVPGSGPQPLGQ